MSSETVSEKQAMTESTESNNVYKTYWDPENNQRHSAYAHGKEVIVRAHDVKKVYRANTEEPVHALRGVSMEIYKVNTWRSWGHPAQVSQPSLTLLVG